MADEQENLKVAPREVDINDLQLVDEQVDINPEADAFAGPPPPDDGDHVVKLSLGPRKVQQGKDKQGRVYYMTHVQGKVQPGDKFEGRVTFHNPSTMVMQGTGTSAVVGVLKALGEPVSAREGVVDLTRRLVNRLAAEPAVTQTTQWTAFCKSCKDDYDNSGGKRGKKNGIVLRGQRNFPQDGNGGHRHQVECKNCGDLLTANADVMAYKPAPTAG